MPWTAEQKHRPLSATRSNSVTGTSLPRGMPWRSGKTTRTEVTVASVSSEAFGFSIISPTGPSERRE